MREILFRGKRTDTGEWLEGFFAKSGDKTFIIIDNDIAVGYVTMKEVIPETVGQYTGLTDKNGKKIFEGDIIQNEKSFIYGSQYKCPVVFDNGEFSAENFISFKPRDFKYCEVIGNIHDNPDLL